MISLVFFDNLHFDMAHELLLLIRAAHSFEVVQTGLFVSVDSESDLRTAMKFLRGILQQVVIDFGKRLVPAIEDL